MFYNITAKLRFCIDLILSFLFSFYLNASEYKAYGYMQHLLDS